MSGVDALFKKKKGKKAATVNLGSVAAALEAARIEPEPEVVVPVVEVEDDGWVDNTQKKPLSLVQGKTAADFM